MSAAKSMDTLDGVQGDVAYLLPTSELNRRYVSPQGRLNLSEYETHTVFVRDARPVADEIDFDTHGFRLVDFPTSFTDLHDSDAVESSYLPEVAHFVKELTKADLVLNCAWMARCSDEARPGPQPPANDVHVDYTPDLSEWMARMLLERADMADYSFDRFLAINCWRSFTPGPQDWPLGLCNAHSVGPEEGAVHGILHVDELPRVEDVPFVLPEGPSQPISYDFSAFRYNPNHEWYHLSGMAPDEVVLFMNYDSRRVGAWRVPHAGFRDPTCPATRPRESIEVRTVAYFR